MSKLTTTRVTKENVDNPFESPAIISFCTGTRGLEQGVERVIGPMRIATYVEICSFICFNLVQAMEKGALDPAPVWTNARTFVDIAHKFYGKVHGITGGYPCQGESLAGKRELENYPGYLWPAIRESMRAIRPVWGYFENVDDHLTGTFKYVLDDLHQMGYAVEAGVYSAQEVGAPHERQRIFILAIHHTYLDRYRQEQQVRARRNSTEPACKVANHPIKRLPSIKITRQHPGYTGFERCGGELADTTIGEDNGRESGDLGETKKGRKSINSSANTGGTKLADTNDNGERARPGEVQSTGQEAEGTQQRKERDKALRERGGPEPGNEGELGNTTSTGLERRFRKKSSGRTKSCQWVGFTWARRTHTEKFPAGPGQPQFSWEHPRTIPREAEPIVGLTVDGFRFREDILRALGNAVVPDQAELAFRTLLAKHGLI